MHEKTERGCHQSKACDINFSKNAPIDGLAYFRIGPMFLFDLQVGLF